MPKRSTRGKPKNFFGKLFERIFFLFFIIWKSIPTLVITAIFYFAFFGVKDLLSNDSFFQIASIKIFPRGILTDQEYQTLEKRSTGVNILKADLHKLRAIIEANPKVKQADVLRNLPNELEIMLTPRKVAVQLKTSPQGAYYTLGEDAVVMSVNSERDISILEFLHFDYPVKRLRPLDRYASTSWRKLESILEFLKKSDVTKKEKVVRVSVDKTGSFTVSLLDGLELVLHDTSDLTNQKMVALGNLLSSDERNLISYIDLRHLDIILKYK